jgi:predicted CXXCH cytochrome family protein
VGRTEIEVHLEIKGGKALSASVIDGNTLIDQAEWHALEDLLHTEYKGRYAIETTYRALGDPHTITTKPAKCDACHGSAGHFTAGRLRITGSENLEIPIDTRIFIPELPSAKEFGRTVHGRAGVACTDCHLSQKKIAEGGSENIIVCGKCHEAVQDVYSRSVHVKIGATHCVECHNPHRITSYKDLGAKARIAVCSRCHKDYVRRHAWLPNTSLHFDYLECATCHSPRSKKSMVFYFARKSPAGKAKLSYDELVALTGQDPALTLGQRQGSPDGQIGRLFTLLAQRDKNVVIDASIIVTKAYHDYSETHLRERQCVTCHSREAQFYDSMFFLLPGRESSNYIPVKDTLLATYPIGTSVDFFLLGEDKLKKDDVYRFLRLRGQMELGLKWIDFFGFMAIVLVLVGVAALVALRLTVRK